MFDQVLQFAAILTNNQLEEVDRFEIRCLPWIVPAPMALKVTGITTDMLDDASLPSFYEMMSEIRARLENWGPAIYAGYNSMWFDEPLLQAASHLYEGVFSYPATPRGRTGFKLDQLAPMNGFAHENAHDALGDVEATIFIARMLAEKCPELWISNVATARKSAMASMLVPGKPFLFVEYFISGPSVWRGQRIDQQGAGTSAANCLRLDANRNEILLLDRDALEERLKASPKPLRDIALNKAPIMLDQSAARALGFVVDLVVLRQSEILSANEVACARLLETADAIKEPWPEPEYLEQRIFEGFPSRQDAARMDDFHRADWTDKAGLIRSFDDERLRQLAKRVVYASAPDILTYVDQKRICDAIAGRLYGDHGNSDLWRTIP